VTANAKLEPDRFDFIGAAMKFGIVLRIEDDLGDAVAVAQIDEEQPSVVAHSRDPSAQGDCCPDMFTAQRAAGVSSSDSRHI